MKNYLFLLFLFVSGFGLAQNNDSIIVTGKVIERFNDDKFNHGIIIKLNLYDNNKKLIRKYETDINGIFKLYLSNNQEYYVAFIFEPNLKKGRLVSLNTVGTKTQNKKEFLLPMDISYTNSNAVELLKIKDLNPDIYFYFNAKYGKMDASKNKPIKDNITQDPTSKNYKNNKFNLYLSVRARNGEAKFNDCVILKNGEISSRASGVQLDTEELEDAIVILGEQFNTKLSIDCSSKLSILLDYPGFFKKQLKLNLYQFEHKFKCTQLNQDTIKILLDSCFCLNNDNAGEYEIATYYFNDKQRLVRQFTPESYIEQSVVQYNKMIALAQKNKAVYYQSYENREPVKPENSNSTYIESDENEKVQSSSSSGKGLDNSNDANDLIEEDVDQSIAEIQIKELETPYQSKPAKAIFKEEPAVEIPKRLKHKFQQLGFDSLKIYEQRNVSKKIEALAKITDANVKSEKDTLHLYTQLYKLNSDFIFIGKDKLKQLANDTGMKVYKQEIQNGIEEKLLENYFIFKEIKELKLKIHAQNSELQYERNRFLLLFLIVIILIGFANNFYKNQKKTKELNSLLSYKIEEINDSISYAQRIQFAILPTKEAIVKAFPQSFILFKPKDIVSGDFYWFQEIENKKYIAACDCTGHGVPGALMSMVATDMLNEALVHHKELNKILEHTNKSIKTALKQTADDESTRDGMDLALCCFDEKNKVLHYAGAYRPLWLIRTTLSPRGEPERGLRLLNTKPQKLPLAGLLKIIRNFM